MNLSCRVQVTKNTLAVQTQWRPYTQLTCKGAYRLREKEACLASIVATLRIQWSSVYLVLRFYDKVWKSESNAWIRNMAQPHSRPMCPRSSTPALSKASMDTNVWNRLQAAVCCSGSCPRLIIVRWCDNDSRPKRRLNAVLTWQVSFRWSQRNAITRRFLNRLCNECG